MKCHSVEREGKKNIVLYEIREKVIAIELNLIHVLIVSNELLQTQ